LKICCSKMRYRAVHGAQGKHRVDFAELSLVLREHLEEESKKPGTRLIFIPTDVF
jgi:hypothetical protein